MESRKNSDRKFGIVIAQRLVEIQSRISAAAKRGGRSHGDITLVAVSKTQPAEKIVEAIAAGHKDFGENYAQELVEHLTAVGAHGHAPLNGDLRWHFIGHLQRNKVKLVMGKVSLIHSVDSQELALEIDKRAAAFGGVQSILIEVNVGGEKTKAGIRPDEVEALVSHLAPMQSIDLRGFMAIPPASEDLEEARGYFRLLREIREDLNRKSVYKHPLAELSMGMTHDFETAIEEGATIVRVGTGIFGERKKI